MASFRKRKNEFFDKILGPEQVSYKTPFSEPTSSYDDNDDADNEIGFGVKEAGPNTKAAIINHMAGKGRLEELNTGANEAKIVSLGKFKEEKEHRKMMEDNE